MRMKSTVLQNKSLPIVLIVLYLLFILLLYEIGPFAWVTEQPLYFYLLQFSYIFFIVLGYYAGIHSNWTCRRTWLDSDRRKLLKIIKPLIFFTIIIFCINVFREYGYTVFDFRGLLKDIQSGIQDMGAGYLRKYTQSLIGGSRTIGGNFFSVFNYLWNFVEFNTILLGILYFKKLGWGTKILILFACSEIVVFYISVGTNIGVFRIILAVILFYILNILSRQRKKKREKRNAKKKIVVITLTALLIILVYFVKTMRSRGGILYWDDSSYNIGQIGLDRDSIVFRVFPEELYIPIISVSSYLTQGLYGFALCLNIPWTPMFGLGGSLQFVDLLKKYFIDLTPYTYQYKMEQYGWDSRMYWASAYSWFANDVGLVGVVVIMFILGYFLALAYRDSLTTDNPFARIMVYYFAIIFLFLPCNNQIFQSIYTFSGFITAFLCWMFSTRYKVIIK